MVCNRLRAQRVSAASLCLFYFLPLLYLIHIHSVCAEVCVCVQLCRRCVCLTITEMFRDNKDERMKHSDRECIIPFLTRCKPMALFHCRNFSRNRLKKEKGMLSACRQKKSIVLVFTHGPKKTPIQWWNILITKEVSRWSTQPYDCYHVRMYLLGLY